MAKFSLLHFNRFFLKALSLALIIFYFFPTQGNSLPKNMTFKGFHVGVNLGYGVGFSRERFQTTAPGGIAVNAKDKTGLDGIDGGINLGYTYVFSGAPFALGLEGLANWSNVKGTRNFSATVGGISANFTAKARMKQTLQLLARIGYALGRAMPFIKVGWDNSAWEFNSTASITPGPIVINKKQHKRINGIAYGGGIDVLLCRNIIAGLEYTHVDFRKQTITINPQTRASYEPHINKFAVVVKFLF